MSDVWRGLDSTDSHSAVLHEFYKSAKGTQALIYCFLGVSALQKHDPIKLKMAANTFSIGEESNITPQVWGQHQARGAGRCRRQGNIYFYATVVTATACCCCLAAFACWVRLGRTSHHNVPSNCCTTSPTRVRPRIASAVSPCKNPCNAMAWYGTQSVSYSPMNLRCLWEWHVNKILSNN